MVTSAAGKADSLTEVNSSANKGSGALAFEIDKEKPKSCKEQYKYPCGHSDFSWVKDGEFFYLDRTNLIRDIIDDGAKFIVIVKPKGFGKTVNLKMLEHFYSLVSEDERRKKLDFFRQYNIKECLSEKKYSEKCGNFHVFFFNFCMSIDKASNVERITINEINKALKIADSDNCLKKIEEFTEIFEKIIKKIDKNIVVLINEYDTPLLHFFLYSPREESHPVIKSFNNFFRFLQDNNKNNEKIEKIVLKGFLAFNLGIDGIPFYTMFSSKLAYYGITEDEIDELKESRKISEESIKIFKEKFPFFNLRNGGKKEYSLIKFVSFLNYREVNCPSNESDAQAVEQVAVDGSDEFMELISELLDRVTPDNDEFKTELYDFTKSNMLSMEKLKHKKLYFFDKDFSKKDFFNFLICSGYVGFEENNCGYNLSWRNETVRKAIRKQLKK